MARILCYVQTSVLCLSPDRLARHYPYQWVVMDELQRCGIRLLFVNQLGNADDPAGQFLLGMQALFAEYERTQITERLRRGKLYRMRQGQLLYSRVPYGYRYLRPPVFLMTYTESPSRVVRSH